MCYLPGLVWATDLYHYTGATAELTHAVAEFFDQVYVMDDNPKHRSARLGLLAAITELGEQALAWEHLHTWSKKAGDQAGFLVTT